MNDLSPDELALLERAASFIDTQVRPRTQAWAAGRGDARDVLPAAAASGLLGVQVPPALGGAGLSFGCKSQLAERLAAVDFGLAMSLINTHNVATHLASAAMPALAQRWVPPLLAGERIGCTALTEPGAGSDFAAIETSAGAPCPAAGGSAAARPGSPMPRSLTSSSSTRRPGPAAVPRALPRSWSTAAQPGFSARAPCDIAAPHSMGIRRLPPRTGITAPTNELLHPPGEAFKAALVSINGARIYVAAMCCGMLGESLRVVVSAYGAQRHTFGLPLQEHQGWRWPPGAGGRSTWKRRRALVEAAGRRLDAGDDVQASAASAKVFATEMAQRHLPALLHAMGAEGLRHDHVLMRHLAAAQTAALVDGSTEMLLERVARGLRPR
jgi:alkylation response protein AidB-like acyl-CoA dehydrogenase